MAQVTGIVQQIKKFPAPSGATMYSVVVDGASYGWGSYPPKCSEGETVTFDVVERGQYKNAVAKSLRVTAKATEASVSKALASAASAGAAADNRQSVISKQAALNSALAFTELLIQAEAVPGITKTTKAEDKYNILNALVLEKMAEYYHLNTGAELEGHAPAEAAKPAAGPVPDRDWK